MNRIVLTMASMLLAGSALPLSAQTPQQQRQQETGAAAGAITGGAAGAVGGALVGGPVGAAIGGAAGAAAGAVGGAVTGSITADDQIYVRERVIRHNVPSVRYQGDIVVGAELPGTVRYYEIENEPRFTNYRYTRLNDRYVLVNTDNRIVAVFD